MNERDEYIDVLVIFCGQLHFCLLSLVVAEFFYVLLKQYLVVLDLGCKYALIEMLLLSIAYEWPVLVL